MPISNCTRCGSVFSRVDKPICPKCLQKEEEDFQKAVDWLRENPGQNIQAVSDATGVERQDILRWVRENRIVIAEAPGLLGCKKCGAPISTGNFCEKCKLELSHEVDGGFKSPSKGKSDRSPGAGMHYLRPERQRKRTL